MKCYSRFDRQKLCRFFARSVPRFHPPESVMLPTSSTTAYAWDVPRCTQLHCTNPASYANHRGCLLRSFPEDTSTELQQPEELFPAVASTFTQDLRESLVALWESKQYSDVRLQARSGEEVLAHRLVISARSSHLAELLAEAPSAVPTRLVVDAERDALVGTVAFLYTDELPPEASVEQLLCLRLQVRQIEPLRAR